MLEDIQKGAAQVAALQGRDQRCFVDDLAARDVDHHRARRQQRQCGGVDEAAGLRRQRTGQQQPLRAGQHRAQLRVRPCFDAGPRGLAAMAQHHDVQAQHRQQRLQAARDRAPAEQQHRLAAQIGWQRPAQQRLPGAALLRRHQLRQPARQRQQAGQCAVCHHFGVGAARGAHGDAARLKFGVDGAVVARRMGVHPGQFAGAAQHAVAGLQFVQHDEFGRQAGEVARDEGGVHAVVGAQLLQRQQLHRPWPAQRGNPRRQLAPGPRRHQQAQRLACGCGCHAGLSPRWHPTRARRRATSRTHAARKPQTAPACRPPGRRLRGSVALPSRAPR